MDLGRFVILAHFCAHKLIVSVGGAGDHWREIVGTDTLLSQMVKTVSHAQRSQASIQRLADWVASYIVPAVSHAL